VIRVELPYHLRLLAKVEDEVRLDLAEAYTIRAVIIALEKRFPALAGTIWDRAAGRRRPFIRFFACGQDWSHMSIDAELPVQVRAGVEPLLIIGAVAGG
jgi:hypothetical protein